MSTHSDNALNYAEYIRHTTQGSLNILPLPVVNLVVVPVKVRQDSLSHLYYVYQRILRFIIY